MVDGDMTNLGRVADRGGNGEANATRRCRLRGEKTRLYLRPTRYLLMIWLAKKAC